MDDSIPSWDEYFIKICEIVALRSKDTSMKVGCVIVGTGHEILSTGYNSFPRGLNDYVKSRYERPEKYYWFEHAERNAIYNSARHGIKLLDSTIYISLFPCPDCARAIVSVGCSKVVVKASNIPERWQYAMGKSRELLIEAGIEIKEI